MKKIFFSLLALAAVMVSCSTSDDVSSSASGTSTSSIAAYVADNYSSTTVVSTTSTRSSVTATLNTGETITFSKTSGAVIAYANNSSAGLAADSLATSDSTSTSSGHKHHGPKGKHGHPRHGHNEVAIDSLLTTINDYIVANYPSYKVIHAQKDTLCSGIVTSVMVCDSAKEPIKLVFSASGTFLMSGVRALSASFPTTVLTAVTSSFANYTLRPRGSVYTLADGTIEYKVYLKSDSVKNKAVFFNADGTIACEL